MKTDTKIIIGGVALVAYVAYKALNSAKNSSSDLVQGLLNPIDSLGAVKNALTGNEVVKNTSTAQLTENYKAYLAQFGGLDAYLKKKQNGTFTGAPYDANIDYRKKAESGGFSIWGTVTAPSMAISNAVSGWFD